jgi:hypothetical protein
MIELLKDIKKIDCFNIVVMDKLRETNPEMFRPDGSMHYHLFEEKIRPFNFIYLRNDVNSITFNLKKANQEGCHISTMIETCALMLEVLNEEKKNNHIEFAINHLQDAMGHLNVAANAIKENKQ